MNALDYELRQSPRVSVFQPILCEGSSARLARSETGDLSLGGMFVDLTHVPFEPGEVVTAHFSLDRGENPVVAEAGVNYVQEGLGMGLCFLNLLPADRQRIAAFVEGVRSRPVMRGEFHLRKSSRVSINLPVRVRATQSDGSELDERSRIITLSKHGACLLLSGRMDVGTKLLLQTPSGREFKSAVVWRGDSPSRSDGQVGIQCRGLAQSLGFQFP
jgi:c-di-GMP-binding flagellar brake protein YcgR